MIFHVTILMSVLISIKLPSYQFALGLCWLWGFVAIAMALTMPTRLL
jgi:hypothetical protein